MKLTQVIHVISKLIKVYLCLLLLNSNSLASEECPISINLIYSNGMLNSYEDAEEALLELRKDFEFQFDDFHVAYNHNEPILTQALEVYKQKESSTKKFLWSYFSKLDGPDWFKKILIQKIQKVNEEAYIRDLDLSIQVEQYKKLYLNENGVFVVAHSQGNFYANTAYELLEKYYQQTYNKQPQFRIISVANPDHKVGGDAYGGYFTLNSDGIIKHIPLSLPPNISNSEAGLFDHEFIKHYLHGNNSGPKIKEHISNNLKRDFSGTIGSLHNSLTAMSVWYKKFSRNPPASLDLHQCMAIRYYIEALRVWHGAKCKTRSLEGIKKDFEECFEREWGKDQNRVFYRCTLPGLTNWGNSMPAIMELQNFKNCTWEDTKVHQRMNRDLIEKTLSFISNPN